MGFDITKEFSGNYVKASDVSKPVVVTIAAISKEKIRNTQTNADEEKMVVNFSEQGALPLVLNKTNAFAIGQLYGTQTDGWVGRQIELFESTVNMQGRMVPCVRIRQPIPQQQVQPVQQPQQVQPAQQPPQQAPFQAPPLDA